MADDDMKECIFTDDDPPLAVTITHHRDKLSFGGKVEQDYRFILYDFTQAGAGVTARMYLDDARRVSLTSPNGEVPDAVLFYLQRRFDVITRMGDNGYEVFWEASA